MNDPRFSWLVVRLLMAAMFVESFIDKLIHWQIYVEETASKGIPLPQITLGFALAVEVLGSLTLVSGRYIRLGAVVLAGYIFTLSFIYFDFWNQQGVAAVAARKEFIKDFGIIAGLLLIALVTPGTNYLTLTKRRSL